MNSQINANSAEQEADNSEIVENGEQPVAPEKTEARPPEIIEENSSQTVQAKLDQALRDSQETQADTRLLAQSMDYARHISEDNGNLDEARFGANLEDVLKRFVPDESKRKEVAAEIVEFEKTLVAPFRAQLEARTAPEQKEQTAEAIAAVRESFYGVVINGLLSGKKISEIIGSINYSKTPGSEVVAGGAFDPSDFCAYFKVQQDDRVEIYVYEKFLGDQNKAYIMDHELSHAFAEASNLWQNDVYDLFLRSAATLKPEDIESLEKAGAPELAEVIEALKNPDSHIGLWNNYIQKRFTGLKNLTGDNHAKERVVVAREIVAEMIAPYLKSGKSAEGYLAAKLQFTGAEELHSFLLRSSGCRDDEELQNFCQRHDINMEQCATGEDLLREFSKVDEFRSFFRLCNLFKTKLDRDFSSIQKAAPASRTETLFDSDIYEIFEEDDFGMDIDDFGATSLPAKNQSLSSPSGQSGEPQKSFIEKFFDWLSPKKPKGTTPTPKKIA